MTTSPHRIVLDNSVISTFHDASELARILEIWPGRWLVPVEVEGEAAAWKVHGATVRAIIRDLDRRKVVEITAVDPRSEGPLFVQMARRLGQGESAVIAIAYHRGFMAALDDRRARRACDGLKPPLPWVPTEGILGYAVADGLLTRAEAEAIWHATSIVDPKRFVP
jgi:predicted nucleic acid-binding protein